MVRELEKSKANLADKCDDYERQQDNVFLITNEAIDRPPLNMVGMNKNRR